MYLYYVLYLLFFIFMNICMPFINHLKLAQNIDSVTGRIVDIYIHINNCTDIISFKIIWPGINPLTLDNGFIGHYYEQCYW